MSETTPYAFHYNDTSFIVYDLTDEDYRYMQEGMRLQDGLAVLSIGLFKTKDIRAIVKQLPTVEAPKSAEPELTPEDQAWFDENKAAWENFGKEEQAE